MIAGPRREAVQWAKLHALPLWHQRGWDAATGSFYERFDTDGAADTVSPRRVRVQARQIYVYAHAAALGWYEPGREIALKGFDWLVSKFRLQPGVPGFVHLLGRDGGVLDDRIDSYDQAFCLLALAWIYRLTNDVQVRALIDDELAFLDAEIADPATGGWREGVPDAGPRRQNPQMHAYEAMLALYEATGDLAMLARADGFAVLAEARLIEGRSKLFEFFDDDMAAITEGELAQVWPGHHFEWVWLLHTHARLAGTKMSATAQGLLDWAMAHGIGAHGFTVDECRPDGHVSVSSSRLWPQTEYIKAWLALEEQGVDGAAEKANAMLDRLMARFFTQTPRGAWIDRIDAGNVTIDGNMPASSFYHVFCCIAEADRVARKP